METMVTVERALGIIQNEVTALDAVPMSLKDVNGLVLAEDIISTTDIPAFPQSSMDGYAFAFSETTAQYTLVGEIAAGSNQNFVLQHGMAVRIFTGAPVPTGADTVLMQEKAKIESGALMVLDEKLKKGDNVRTIGAEIGKGNCALKKGAILKPGSIGLLAGIGVAKVLAYPRPKLGIIVTGNELQKPGMPLNYGQVYESNSHSLLGALNQLHINDVNVVQVKDDLEQLSNSLTDLLKVSDMVLMTGGVSVGDYDFTVKTFEQSALKAVFHKIKQKPGKPLLFGRKGNKLVFGLPGNPASVLTCFYEYVLPAIGMLMQQDLSLKKMKAAIAQDYTKPVGITHFLKAFYNGKEVCLQAGQESYKLSSYASANCLVVMPEDCSEITAGTMITIHLLP
ncbi:MAG: hypothetical protein RLZZ28_2547 [Bacteroidota bacterium]|jgi:molybdopterin molybdotransferase